MERKSQKIVLFVEEGFQNDTRNFESLRIIWFTLWFIMYFSVLKCYREAAH